MSRETDNLTAEEVNALDIPRAWKVVANMPMWACVTAMILVVGTVVGVVGSNSFSADHALKERYQRTDAVIVSEPDIANGTSYRGYATVTATVRTDTGIETTTAVDRQAQAGDTVSVWLDTDTGKLWRAMTPTSSPIVTDPWTDTIFSGFLAVVGMVALFGLLGWRTVRVLELGVARKHANNRARAFV